MLLMILLDFYYSRTPPPDMNGTVTWKRAIIRWLVVYTLCVACVCQWRGIWVRTT